MERFRDLVPSVEAAGCPKAEGADCTWQADAMVVVSVDLRSLFWVVGVVLACHPYQRTLLTYGIHLADQHGPARCRPFRDWHCRVCHLDC